MKYTTSFGKKSGKIDFTSAFDTQKTVFDFNPAVGIEDEAIDKGGKIGELSLDALIMKLGSLSWNQRKAAAKELARRGNLAIPLLVPILDTDNEDTLYWCIHALGEIGTPEAIKPLIDKLENSDSLSKSRAYIAAALSEAQDPALTTRLIGLLADDSWTVCSSAMESLEKKGEPIIDALVEALKTASYNQAFWITKTLSRLGESGVRHLIKFMGFKNINVRLLVTEALGESDSPLAVEALLHSLNAESWLVRQSVIEALVKLGPITIEPLLARLRDASQYIYEAAGEIMEQLGERGVSPLISLLDSESRQMRKVAAEFLGKTKSERAIKPLLERLNDPVWLVRKSAARGLQDIGEKAIEPLMAALETEDENVKYWITSILGKIGDKTLDPLIKLLKTGNKEMRFFAAQALGQTRDVRAVTPLVQGLQDKSWPVRKGVAQALTQFGSDAVIPVLKSLLSTNEDLRFWARKVIEDIGSSEIPLFIKLLTEDSDAEMRYFAAYGLSLIGDYRCVDALTNALKRDSNEWVRKYAASALAKIGQVDSVPHLIEAFKDDNQEVAYWVAKATGNMGPIAIPALQEALRAEDERSRLMAIMAMGAVGDEASLRSLVILMSTESEEGNRAQRALASAGELAIPILVEALGSQTLNIRNGAAAALIKIGEPAVEALLEAVNSGNEDVNYWATKALREIRKN